MPSVAVFAVACLHALPPSARPFACDHAWVPIVRVEPFYFVTHAAPLPPSRLFSPGFIALRLCPSLVFVKCDFAK